jgi:hypothetical protein
MKSATNHVGSSACSPSPSSCQKLICSYTSSAGTSSAVSTRHSAISAARSFPALRKVPDEGRLRAGPNISPSTGLPRRSCVYLFMVPIFLCWEGSGRVSQNVERRQPRTAPPCARTLPSQSSRQRLKTSQVGNCWVNWTTMLDDETFDMGLRAIRDLRRCRSGADADDPVMQTAIERCAETIALSEQIRARARCAATPQPRSMMHCGCHARPKR